MQMHKDGSLADLLGSKKLIIEEEGDVEGEQADAARLQSEQSTGGRSMDAKGQTS